MEVGWIAAHNHDETPGHVSKGFLWACASLAIAGLAGPDCVVAAVPAPIHRQGVDNDPGLGARPWKYRPAPLSRRTRSKRVPVKSLSDLILRAEANFRASPAFAELGPLQISAVGGARRVDGTTVISFEVGGMSDTRAIYIFDSHGRIVDRYLHSFWG